jgi:nucleotide-binding universal stress UspA family protein
MARIIVGVDRSDASASALRWAVDEARQAHADLLVVHAHRPTWTRGHPSQHGGDPVEPQADEAALTRLTRFIEAAGVDLKGVEIMRRLHVGRAADGLLEAARTASLLVIGARGAGGFEGLLLGSTAEHCARHAICPVVVVPARSRHVYGRISVGTDGSRASERALAWAVEQAAISGASLEVVGVYRPYDAKGPYGGEFMQIADPGSTERFQREAEQHVQAAIASLGTPAPVPITAVVLAGHPARILIERSATSDLLVVGRRGRDGFPGLLLGSVTRQVLHHTSVPVAVVPS